MFVMASVLVAASCGDFQLAEFTRASTTTIEVVSSTTIPGGLEEQPTSTTLCSVRMTIQEGENLGVIADRCGVTVALIMAENGIERASEVRAGQMIVLPDPSAPVEPPWKVREREGGR